MSIFGLTIVKQPKVAASTSSRKAGKTAKPKSSLTLSIALAMAAVNSVLDDSVVVPYVEVTVGDLAHKIGVRPNGTLGNHYPNAFGHEAEAMVAATEWLVKKGQRPKGHPKPKASVPESQPAIEAELAALKAQMQLLVSGKPLPAEGHTIGEPEPAPVEIEAEVAIGNIVAIGDDLYEVAEAKNGKPFLRHFA